MKINIPREKIADFCKRWKIEEFALPGSALDDDPGPESDVDVLVTFAPNAPWSRLDRVDMQEELKTIFGRNVNLINRRDIEGSCNPIHREILESAKVIYAVT